MIQSMTGYGKTNFEFNIKSFSIELRSLNSKQLDLNIKVPPLYREKELDIRNIIANELSRGKIEVTLYADIGDDSAVPVINQEIAKKYYEQLQVLSKNLNLEEQAFIMPTLLRLPEIFKTGREELDMEEWEVIFKNLGTTIQEMKSFRKQEGKSIDTDIRMRIKFILEKLEEIKYFENQRIESVKTRIRNSLNEILSNEKIDENRFEQELIYYLEKLDITEEKVRLKNHCDYFLETMDADEPVGKKLGFISQEIGREINTIGSKANDADIQKLVVIMKDELEKIKEQLMNVL